MRFPHQTRAAFAELACGPVRQRLGAGRQQELPGPGQRHQTRGHRLGQAFHFHGLGACLDRLGAVFPGQDLANMQSGAGTQNDPPLLADGLQALLVIQREPQCVDRTIKQQKQAVRTVNLVPVPQLLQPQYQSVVMLEKFSGRRVTDALHQDHRVAQIGEQQRPHLGGLGRRSVVAVHADLPPIRVRRSRHATSAAGCRPGAWPGTARCRRERTTRSSRCGAPAGARRC